jgi:replicative DNA helicase
VVRARAADYDLNVVDYIGLMKPDGNGRAVDDWRVMAAISNELKEIALGANTRMLVASQINREGDNSLAPPKLKNLSQSDALGQDGDVVLTLMKYRRQAGATHFSIEKQRDGEADVQFWSRFDVDTGNYDEITRDEADELTDNWGDD